MSGTRAPPLNWVVATLMLALTTRVVVGQVKATSPRGVSMTDDNFVFTLPLYNGTIYENTIGKAYIETPQKMGIHIGHPSSIDVEYTIVEGDPHNVFKAETTPVKDFCFLRIRTQTLHYGMLNRELNAMFHLKVKARGSYPGDVNLETFTDVVVTVLDQNEFSPLFSSVPYEVSIPEDTPLHRSIGQVKASDADIGINGEIYYSFVQATLVFAIHPTTGVVSLSRPVRYDHRQVYELDVLAEDRGVTAPGRISPNSKTKFKINILPVNYKPPTIKVHNHQSLVENGNIGSVFAVLTVIDEDRTTRGDLASVTITNDLRKIFSLVAQSTSGTYNIVVMSPIDREVIPENYNITVVATDNGTPQKSSTVVIPVRVQDVNDNEPEFEQNVYAVEISEIVPLNTPVVFVKAHDRDLGSNGDVRYSIVDGNKKDLFTIDPVSGLIRTSGQLDAEIEARITLVVQAQDQANIGSRKTGQARVIINLIDYNDNTPDLNMLQDVYTVRENLPRGSRVASIMASDEDSGDNGRLSYNLVNSDSVPFEIDPFLGEITTKEVLDFETMRRSYQLHVRVSDRGAPFKREEDAVVNVRVEDVNDNSPEFIRNKCSGHLSRDAPLKLDVVTLAAVDFDSGNIITYSIVDGNEDDCFSIVPSSGIITVNCDMSSQDGTRTLQVVASDGQHVSIPAVVEMILVNNKRNPTLGVGDVNINCQTTDAIFRHEQQVRKSQTANAEQPAIVLNKGNKGKNNPPVISSSLPSYVEVSESASVGLNILDFGASVTDDDPGFDGQLKYVISTGDDTHGAFKLDTFTGQLQVLSKLDYETKSQYALTLTAIDLGQSPQTVSTEIRVIVLDENDNAPFFEKPTYTKRIGENVPVNSTVIQVKATDLDSGENAEIQYSILSDDRDFYIDPVQGVIKVRRPLDREARLFQALTIQAQDSGTKTKLATSTVVNITIADINDNAPKFVPGNYHVRVREDLPIGAVITTLTAHDVDEGDNGRVTYSFAHGIDGNFDIDAETGSIRIKRKLDYETKQVYNLTGVAQDSGQPALTSTCLVNVEVMDVNENLHPPVFKDFLASGSVFENLSIGSYVTQVQATDQDDPSSGVGQLLYSIHDGTGLGRFTIDMNGTIRTSQVLDRETTPHYWLTVLVQDRALVPKFARIEVLIEVADVNDNIPQSVEPAYYASVQENGKQKQNVVQIKATDGDDESQTPTFAITSGNPQNFFEIDPNTGVISTTNRSLDREKQEEHALEVTITDKGNPPLSSTTRVVIKVNDDNDNRPEFINRIQRHTITAFKTPHNGEDIFVYRALAYDRDEGKNANITYTIASPKNSPFRIERYSAKIYATRDLSVGDSFDLMIRASDNGNDSKKSNQRLGIEVLPRRGVSQHKPRFGQRVYNESLTETDAPGLRIVVISAEDEESAKLIYSIEGGNEDDKFTIQPDHGSVFLADTVDWERKAGYNLTVAVTDGRSKDYANILINIIDINDNEPVFTHKLYKESVSENAEVGTPVLRVSATDLDKDSRLMYAIVSAASTRSLDKFAIGAKDGVIVVSDPLDREDLSRHLLTVMVRDQGAQAKRSYARVEINVLDHNDHTPRFLSEVTRGQVYESAAIGTSVVQVMAVDGDKGLNAELTYAILSGNADNTFTIDDHLGIISVAKELDRRVHSNFEMIVSAMDHGDPQLTSSTKVTITVTVSTNSPPKFFLKEYAVELQENLPPGTVVTSLVTESLSTVVYTITAGDEEGYFNINPNSGVVFTMKPIDYEVIQFYNLTINAANIVSASQSINVIVHIVDVNDNAPVFVSPIYWGNISETALIGSMVLDSSRAPLVVQAVDADSNNNARLFYQILDQEALRYFAIDPNTGAIRTVTSLDYETKPVFNFSIYVNDMGNPQLQAQQTANVVVFLSDVNDNPPKFTQHAYQALVVLPTYYDVTVVQVQAFDSDTVFDKPLSYSIASGNDEGIFGLDSEKGVITVKKDTLSRDRYELTVHATDGKFTTAVRVFITVQQAGASPLRFTKDRYTTSVVENSAKQVNLIIIQPLGVDVGTHLTYTLLNNRDFFSVGQTSGVLSTTGLEFDREKKDNYTVVIKVQDSKAKELSAHVVVLVTVEDENDNPPMFLNLPYHCTVSGDAKSGEVIQIVRAADPDIGVNGELRYILADSHGDKFAINPYTREIVVKSLDKKDRNMEITLKVIAEDKGQNIYMSVAAVHVHITDSFSPLFEQPVYEISVQENAAPHTPVIAVKAISPHGQKLIYSISRGDKYGDFALDFNTGYLSVVGHLDYEDMTFYTLTVRATDVFTGSYAEATINISVEDVNDNAPVFGSLTYTHTLSESSSTGSRILVVNATDADSGANSLIYFDLAPVSPGSKDPENFLMNTETGEIILKKALDHEKQKEFLMLAVARDNGMPVLSATALVTIKVLDLNDNPPIFTQPSYDCYVSDSATRGQLVFKVVAFDPDESDADNLMYSIVGGNDRFSFSISPNSGIISLSEQRVPALGAAHILNVSVSDGVYTSFTRVTVDVRNVNRYTPVFGKDIYNGVVSELNGGGMNILTATAVDGDRGNYGMLTYAIVNDQIAKIFSIDADTGDILTKQMLDREEKSIYNFTVSATDNGGKMGFATVVIRVRDENDNVPKFIMEEYRANIPQNASVGSFVMTIKAEDLDEGNNAKLLYTFYQEDDLLMARLFDLNAYSGTITTKASLNDAVNKVFQFFVKVVDQGDPPLESLVPVEILVMVPDDKPPVFPEASRLFFVYENEQVGTVITTFKARSDMPLTYTMVPGYINSTNRPMTFSIDSLGQLRLIRGLDRETTPSYTFSVRAQTKTSPPLVNYMEVNIKVQDINDNPPVFSCNPYMATIPENADPQQPIIQLHATDLDLEVKPLKFYFGPNMTDVAGLFSIDPETGWIILLTQLDREVQNQYNLTVVAMDTPPSTGRKPGDMATLTSTTSVIIFVTDTNDNAPKFDREEYSSAVNEGALPGTVLVTLLTKDADFGPNSEVTYFITQGDQLGQFEIRKSGELLVKKTLDREMLSQYRLTIAATDGAYVTYTTVTIDILDDNDNIPTCDQPIHQVVVNEDIAVGKSITHIRVRDADEPGTINSRIAFSLQGEGAELFSIEKDTGLIRTAGQLDRETKSEFRLTAVATDGGGLSCSTSVLVYLKDVNDNPPVFTQGSLRDTYNIREDAKIHTLLTRVVAQDADTGSNSQIMYKLSPDTRSVFTIDPESGIISLVADLDRESNPSYNLTVIAYNPTHSDLSSETTLMVTVLDVNDNPPEFERSSYYASIQESTRMGAVVEKVKATSLDVGINADITYSIAAGNEQGKFTIDPYKGILTVAEPLDHEVSREYFITVLATDRGTPPLTNTAIVIINITDINDNPPRFSQDAYTVHVLESVAAGTEIFKVIATDSDSPPNAVITYNIMDGNTNNQFLIDPRDGILQIHAPLDREKTSSFSLVIQAHDSGLPMLLSSAVVSIIVDDANDNPPMFVQESYKGLIQEGRRTGIEVVTVSVVDADLPENGPPFSFEIVEGNDNGEFHIDSSGVITTAGQLSKKVQEKYVLKVRAFDSGKPPLYSDIAVEVEVVNDSLYPPEVKNLSITIRSCMNSFPGGVIGRIDARDRDPYDKTIFTIVSPNSHLFDIHRFDGRLIALTSLDAGEYVVNVSVSDGKFTTYGEVDVVVLCTSKEMLDNALTIQFENMIVEQFYANFRLDFLRVLKQELDVRSSDIEIINVQPSAETLTDRKPNTIIRGSRNKRDTGNNNLDVLFTVRKSADKFYNKKALKKKMEKIRGRIETELGARIVDIFTDLCPKDFCKVGTCVGKVHFDESTLEPVMVNGASFVSARHRYTEQCVCLEGDCAEQVCGDKTCTANKICQRNVFGDFSCQCPEGRTGELCENVVPLCSGSSCPIERPMTFAGKSYAKWKLLHTTKKRFSLRLRIRTRQNSAVLMHAKGKVDYSILKIERGSLVYKFDCGSGEGQVRIPVHLSDGQWHMIQLERNGREAELVLDSAYTAMGVAPGVHAILNVESEEIYFGSKVDVFPNGYRDISQGFEGCMEDIRVFDIPLPFSGNNEMAQAVEFELVEFHCQDYPVKFVPGGNACSSNPCLNGGQCKFSGLNSHVCICRGRYKGAKCEIDPDPCQGKPCSNEGRCEVDSEAPNSYFCHCSNKLLGARCSYGKYCLPNPCKQGGTCVEGPTAPLCDCAPGFQGLYCDKQMDPCESFPCQHGGICHNQVGGAHFCNCTAEFTGKNCEIYVPPNLLEPDKIVASNSTLTYGLVGAAVVLLLLVIFIVALLVCQRRRRERRRIRRSTPCSMPDSGSESLLSNTQDKRCKLSNPDLSKPIHSMPSQPPIKVPPPVPPPVPTRPASYTPSTHDSLHMLNNLDSVGNYGSAGDDLENTGVRHVPTYDQYLEALSNPSHTNPAHFMLRKTPPPPSSRASETDSIQKAPWEFEYPNILENYMEADKKQNDKMAKQMPGLHSPQPSPALSYTRSHGRGQGTDTSSVSSFHVSESEDDLNGYHWDTSDWAPGPSMPNISELPTNEILDSPSSSQPSDDCNANADNFDDNITTMAIYNGGDDSPLLSSDEQRRNNIDTSNINEEDDDDDDHVISSLPTEDYFDDSEYVGDSEYAENEPYDQDELPPSYAEHPNYEQLLQALDDSYELPASLNIHPNQYLPDYNFSQQELDIDPLTEDENTDDKPQEARYMRGGLPQRASNNSPDGNLYAPLMPPKEFMTPGYHTDGYTTDQEPPSRTSFIDDMSMSIGGFTSNASCSDISGLCEIEDSEINVSDTDDENTPLNREHIHTQTQV
ncbi:unnamed protein product [Lymnaea stagnalis]|uniref:Uncharacterized protein n=1 Tax=Lymnaea stagnalis TaxID=6523 RepID=A0AAV2H3M7_LYMST